MTHNEMRLCRREIISFFLRESELQHWTPKLWKIKKLTWCKEFVREYETKEYGQELNAYK